MLDRRDFLKLLGAYSLHQFSRRFVFHEPTVQGSGADLPNILILVLDTLSAYRMSLYGCDRETTPNIQRLATRSDVYHHHYAGGNFTSSGTASLLTGTYPWSHRSFNMFGSVLNQFATHNLFQVLPEDYFKYAYTQNSLVRILLDQFKTNIDQLPPVTTTSLASDSITNSFRADFQSAFWGETILRAWDESYLPSTLFLSVLQKFRQALGPFLYPKDIRDLYPLGVPHNYQGTSYVLEDTFDWLRDEVSAYHQPYFAYIHLWPPHEPYWPRAEYVDFFGEDLSYTSKREHYFSTGKTPQELAYSRSAYDAYLAHTDAEIGRLLTQLETIGALDNTILILTSDHGQAFEKGIEGHLTPVMFESLVHIPLLVTWPKGNQRRDFYTPTSAVDLLPSLLHLTGQSIPTWCEGQVLPGFLDSQESSSRQVYSLEAKKNSKFNPITKGTLVLVDGDYKLVRYIGYEGFQDETECFNLKNDPHELVNRYPYDPLARALKEMADQKIQVVNQAFIR
jgi:arylsulfatase A-like enzyme